MLSNKHVLLTVAGIHPTTISESFEKAAAKAVEILTAMATPVALSDRESLLKSAMTSLSSKVRVVMHTWFMAGFFFFFFFGGGGGGRGAFSWS